MTFRAIATLIAGLLWGALSACQTNPETGELAHMGYKPIHLSTVVADGFEKYKEEFISYYFVVSDNGMKSFYIYCENACRPTRARETALLRCEEMTGGKPCKIFAKNHKIVWRGPVTGLYDPKTGRYRGTANIPRCTDPGVADTLPVRLAQATVIELLKDDTLRVGKDDLASICASANEMISSGLKAGERRRKVVERALIANGGSGNSRQINSVLALALQRL